MANEKFTPGPWIIRGLYIEEKSGYHAGDWIAKISEFEDEYKEEERANANIIAAAPDLYKELRSSVDQMQIGLTAVQKLMQKLGQGGVLAKVEQEMKFQIANAQAALAKARGENQEEDSPSSGDQLLDELHQNAPTPYEP